MVDRKYIIITKQANQETESYIITDIDSQETRPFNFSFNKISIDDFKLGKSSKTANLDFSRIKFPLTIRKWKDADKFRPLGMKGTKKVSDFLTDKKVDLISKQNTWVLCHNDQIIWLIGHRIDDRYKITPSTNVVLVISI